MWDSQLLKVKDRVWFIFVSPVPIPIAQNFSKNIYSVEKQETDNIKKTWDMEDVWSQVNTYKMS
jgi:hypothetical protein